MITRIRNIIYIILGLFFILSPFYYKIIVIRLPKNIYDLNIIFCIFIMLIFFILILNIIKNLYFKQRKHTLFSKFVINKIINPLQEIHFNSLLFIDNYIKHILLGPRFVGEPLLKFTIQLNKQLNEKRNLYIFIFFDIAPKLFILVCLFIDISIYKNLNYIYLYGALTLSPLILRYIIYTLKEFALSNIRCLIENYLTFCDKNYIELSFENLLENFLINSFNTDEISQYGCNIALKESLQQSESFDETLNFYLDQLYIFTTLYNNINFLEMLKLHKYYKIFLIINYLCYFLIWCYIVFQLI